MDEPSYQRGIGIQRTFKNLEAEIKVEKVLNEMEIAQWLKKMGYKKT